MTRDEVFASIRRKLDAARKSMVETLAQAHRDYIALSLEQQAIEDARALRIWGQLLTDPPAPWTGFRRPDPPLPSLNDILPIGGSARGWIVSSTPDLDPVLLSHAEARWERVCRRWEAKHKDRVVLCHECGKPSPGRLMFCSDRCYHTYLFDGMSPYS